MGIQSDIVKELRKDKNLTQSDVARYFGIIAPLYCMYETGTRKMSLDMLCALADLLDTSTDYILGRTDDPRPYKRRC